MLSSSASLLSVLSPLSAAGGDAAAAGSNAAPGFAELLNGLATKAVEAVSGEEAGPQGAAEPAGKSAPSRGKTITARGGRLALAAKPATADKDAPATPTVAGQAATAAVAAIETGKILPVGLPEAAEAETKTDAGPETLTVAAGMTTALSQLPVVPGTVPVQAAATEAAAPPAEAAPRRSATAVAQALTHKANPAPSQPADKAKGETQPSETRPVAITVADPALVAAPAAEEVAAAKPVAVRAKPVRAADLARIETPFMQVSAQSAATAQFLNAAPSAQAPAAPTPTMSAPMPSPNDIDAALDHLVAAREALMPAEAALAIDHAEFGEVSIRFEQSSDGRLSAELTAADPELKRAVTAAVATDRGAATTSDGDNGRSAQLPGQRGSAMTGGDAATGGRGQSGTHSGAERDLPQRHAPARSQPPRSATDQGSGVFA
jgi:hypothetical protein